ncbi:MAG: PulJ/GspJ family protein, partial [Bryobacteraceae bacterium]
MKKQAGLTLIEVLIAVSLLGLLSVGMLTAMRVGLSAMGKVNTKLMQNRRIAGTQKVIEQQIAGFMPVIATMTSPLT